MNIAEYEKDLLRRVLDSIRRHGGEQCLSAVILTGSFGRDEQTYTRNDAGDFSLKSDVEIALVVPKWQYKKRVETLVRCVPEEFAEELNLMPISERRLRRGHNFNYTLKTPRRKTLFTYDLFNGSKTIWGKDFIGRAHIALETVDPYEAKRLVANRIGELVCLRQDAAARQDAYRIAQWKGKVLLAIGSAWLLGRGEYASSFHAQKEKLQQMQQELERDVGTGFYPEYEKAFEFLRQSKQPYEVPDARIEGYVRNIDADFKRRGLTAPAVNSVSRMTKYCMKYMRTGMGYGLIGFEDRILQALIFGFHAQAPELGQTAQVWKRVLY